MKVVVRIFPLMMIALLLCSAVAQAAMIDITRPTDAIVRVDGSDDGDGSAGPPPAGEVGTPRDRRRRDRST